MLEAAFSNPLQNHLRHQLLTERIFQVISGFRKASLPILKWVLGAIFLNIDVFIVEPVRKYFASKYLNIKSEKNKEPSA
jgi:hypothetical protein